MKKILCSLVSLFLMFGNLTLELSYAETSEVQEQLKTLEIGNPFNYRNLTIVPVYAKTTKDKTDYVTLDEAVNKGYITITELDGGRVPQVRISNNSNRYILLVAGEILTGCRQDRLVGRDVLIAPKSKDIILPVYCSEQGRWTAKGQYFSTEKSQAEPLLRGMIYGQKSQGIIWDRISSYSAKMGVQSSTSALQETYRDEGVREQMCDYVRRLENIPRLEEDAVGVAVGLGDRIIGIDIFVNASVFAQLWPKLLKSYVALAISEEDTKGSITQEQVRGLLNEIYKASFSRQPGLDLGEELQANTDGMICFALAYRASVTHFAAFPGEGKFTHGLSDTRIPVIE